MTKQDEVKEEAKKVDSSTQNDTEETPTVLEPELTADERMQEYKDKTLAIHQSFIDKFEADEKRIFEVPEIDDVSINLKHFISSLNN